jgi:hypothetical protein
MPMLHSTLAAEAITRAARRAHCITIAALIASMASCSSGGAAGESGSEDDTGAPSDDTPVATAVIAYAFEPGTAPQDGASDDGARQSSSEPPDAASDTLADVAIADDAATDADAATADDAATVDASTDDASPDAGVRVDPDAAIDGGSSLSFYVATDGDDAGPGTFDHPFATLDRARDAVRAIVQSGHAPGGVVVWVRGGRYQITHTFNLTAEDSGTSDSPIIYRAQPGETVRLTGGVPVTGWHAVDDAAILARLATAARRNDPPFVARALLRRRPDDVGAIS